MDRFVTSAGPKKGGGGSSRKSAAASAADQDDNTFHASASASASTPSQPTNIAQPAAIVAVLLSRSTDSSTASGKSKASTTAPVKLAVAVRLPRKRVDGHEDKVCYTLQHYVFLDDRRRFTNLDALLTRVGKVDCVHVACTESADVSLLTSVLTSVSTIFLELSSFVYWYDLT